MSICGKVVHKGAEQHSPYDKDKSKARILAAKIIGLSLLVIVGTLAPYFSYAYIYEYEDQLYRESYRLLVDEIHLRSKTAIDLKTSVGQHFSTLMGHHCPNEDDWPNCTLPVEIYDDYATKLSELSDSRSFGTSPLVRPEQVGGFVAYANAHYKSSNQYPPSTGYGLGIWSFNADGSRSSDTTGKHPFSPYDALFPVLQVSEVDKIWPLLMFNTHSEKTRAHAIDHLINCTLLEDTIRPSCLSASGILQLVVDHQPRPATVLYIPIYPNANKSLSLVGVNWIVFNWDAVLRNNLPDQFSVDVVVRTKDLSYTYSFRLGGEVTVKEGDHHKSKHDNLRENIGIVNLHEDYQLQLYPSDQLYDNYHSNLPAFAAAGCVFIVIVISSVFLTYDVLVKREALAHHDILEVKRAFVRFISHEIRTPLNTIGLGLELLLGHMENWRTSDCTNSAECGKDQNATQEGKITRDSQDAKLATVKCSEISDVQRPNQAKIEESIEIIAELKANASTAVVVLDDLINFDKIEMKIFHVEKVPLRLWDIIEKVAKPFGIMASQKGVILELQTDLTVSETNMQFHNCSAADLENLRVVGDSIKLSQVVRNLVSNALKFTPEGGRVVVKATWKSDHQFDKHFKLQEVAHPDCYDIKGVIEISVKDSGVGMTQEELLQLYQQGVQFNPNQLQAGGGSGLGLWITKAIVDQHDGFVGATSDGYGKGSCFFITIPAVIFHGSAAGASSSNSSSVELSRGKYTSLETADLSLAPRQETYRINRALVVDDANSNRKILKKILTSKSISCDEACNGKEALEMVNSKALDHYDVILMDFEMPVMNGPTAVEKLRSLGVTSVIIGITGNVLKADVDFFMSKGADAVLPKPLSLSDFFSTYNEISFLKNV